MPTLIQNFTKLRKFINEDFYVSSCEFYELIPQLLFCTTLIMYNFEGNMFSQNRGSRHSPKKEIHGALFLKSSTPATVVFLFLNHKLHCWCFTGFLCCLWPFAKKRFNHEYKLYDSKWREFFNFSLITISGQVKANRTLMVYTIAILKNSKNPEQHFRGIPHLVKLRVSIQKY